MKQPLKIVTAGLLLAGIVTGAWLWFGKDNQGSNSENQANNTNQQTTENTTNEPKTEETQYLVIKEWDVRITLPPHLAGDISYFINDRAERDFGGSVLVDFTSKKFSGGNLKCADIEGDVPRSIVSIEEISLNGNEPSEYEPKPFKTIENKAYRFAKTACEEAIDRVGTASDRKLLNDLKEAVKTTLEKV